MRVFTLSFLLVVLCCTSQPISNVELPRENWFLMESKGGLGAWKAGTVVLVHRSSSGTIGWLIGREFKGNPRQDTTDIPLWEGGPVESERMSFLYLDRESGGIHFSRDVGLLFRIARIPSERSNVRVFVGYCGWAPGQLQAEFSKGMWIARKGNVVEEIFSAK